MNTIVLVASQEIKKSNIKKNHSPKLNEYFISISFFNLVR